MNRFSATGTIISRIFAAAGVIMSVAVLFCVAFVLKETEKASEDEAEIKAEYESELETEFEIKPLFLKLYKLEPVNSKVRKMIEMEGRAADVEAVSFGDMRITLPEGWEVEKRSDEGWILCLNLG